jgi:hypothetical protein
MATITTVTLSSNGKYWQAFYYDNSGRRRAKGLGPKSRLSKRQAKVMCDRLAAQLQTNPAAAGSGPAPKLFDMLARYLESRTEIRTSTRRLYQQTINYLMAFFDDIRIDRITRPMAGDFRTWLAKQKTGKNLITEQTVRKHIRNCKTIFKAVTDEDLLLFNPFSRQKSAPMEPDKDWYYLSLEDLEDIVANCPNYGWRVFLALCRLAGLRQGEALYELLLEAYDNAPEGIKLVCHGVRKNNLRRTFHVIAKRAGLESWSKWCHTLRKNAETDWAQRFPQYVVSYWLGHGIEVSGKHYLQVPEELYRKFMPPGRKMQVPKKATA